MTKIDPATYDETIRRPWYYPGAHERPNEAWPAAEAEAGPELMFAPKAPPSYLGFRIAAVALTAVILGVAAAMVFG